MAKICVMEDDPLMSRMYEKAFRLNGYEVEVAIDGVDGMDKLRAMTVKPDAILLDIMMPHKSGLEVLTELAVDPELASIPVIVLTNISSKDDTDQALKLGAVAYLAKSQYDPKEVIVKVTEIIANAK